MYIDPGAARLMAHRSLWLAQQRKRVSKEAAAALLFTARASMVEKEKQHASETKTHLCWM